MLNVNSCVCWSNDEGKQPVPVYRNAYITKIVADVELPEIRIIIPRQHNWQCSHLTKGISFKNVVLYLSQTICPLETLGFFHN